MAADAPITPPEAAAPKPRRTWLYASVALNLLLAGVLVGNVMREPRHEKFLKHGPPPMAVRDVGFAFMRALPDERRKEVKQKMKAEFGGVKPLFEESMAARKEAFLLLEQDNITPAQVKAALDKAQAVDAQVAERSAEFFAKVVADIPVAERRAAVAEMRKRWTARESMRWKGDGDDRRGPPPGAPMGEGGGPPPPMGEGPPPPP